MMSKTKSLLLLAVIFLLGIGGGILAYGRINASADEIEISVKHYDDGIYGYDDGYDHPPEYQVVQVEFDPDFELWPDAELNVYEYLPLDQAEKVPEILENYFQTTLYMDSYWITDDEGYANYSSVPAFGYEDFDHSTSPAYNLSANRYSGKFSFSSSRSYQDIKIFADKYAKYDFQKCYPLMEQSAADFVQRFAAVTGDLTLDHYERVEMSEGINYDTLDDITEYFYTGAVFYFTGEHSTDRLTLCEDLPAAVKSGGQEQNYFVVYVRPDGSIQMAENYLTQAPAIAVGTKPPISKEFLEKLASSFYSAAQNDTLVYRRIKAVDFHNYFGYKTIEPLFTVEYYYKSAPDEILETQFVYNLALVDY